MPFSCRLLTPACRTFTCYSQSQFVTGVFLGGGGVGGGGGGGGTSSNTKIQQ